MTNEPSATGGLQSGDRIGKYVVRERLGTGGQSIVYKAYDELLDRFVAVKQVAPHLAADANYLAMLRENFRRIAHLGQHNEAIVTIHDVLDDPRGLFYVMEFVEGHTLEKILAESPGPFESRAALLILFRLASALHDVHAEGIVHRDMKPGNIILTEHLRPKIIDFGVAAFGNQDASMPLATTKYLAPELYSRPDADARADLYSLGFILYEMLLGRAKFNEIFEDVVRDPHSAALRWMKWHGNESVTAPPLRQVNPAVPPALSEIVMKLIEKDPQNRFADAEELGRAIKMNFSARFRRTAAGEAPPELNAKSPFPPPLPPRPETAGNEPPPTPVPPAPEIAPLDDEPLDLDGPATAPLPKTPLSPARRMTILIAAGVLFLGLLGGGIAWLLQMREASRNRALSAAQMFDQAVGLYEQGKYDSALETFQQLRKKHGGTTPSTRAEVLAAMCRARIAIEKRRWSDAQLEEQHARDSAEAIQAGAKSAALIEWTRDVKNQIEQIGQTRLSTNTFWDAMDQADARLDQATRADDFDEILREFNQKLGAPGVGLTAEQETKVAEMQRQIARRKFLFLVNRHIQEGDALLERKDYDTARAAYKRAETMVRDHEALQTIPPERRDSILRQLEARMKDLSARRHAERAYRAVRDAEKAGDYDALQKALREVLKLPSLRKEDRGTYETQLRTIEANQGVETARVLFENKQYEKALEELDRVKKIQPDHLGAQTLRAGIETAQKQRDAVQAGDAAVGKKEFSEALKQYRKAETFGASEEIKTKIRDAEYEMHLQQADALVKEEQYDKALVEYNEAKRVKPSSSAHVETKLMLMRTRQKYGQFLAKGDEALKKKRWEEAVRWYKQARQQTQEPREVDRRISETYYRKFLTGGKTALEEKNLPVARWNFKQALRYKDTPEARKLLQQAGGEEEE
jgi:serine/threonine protein kinase